MVNYDKILKSVQWNQKMSTALDLSSQMVEILKAQKDITGSFSGISMINEIAKSMKYQPMFVQPPSLAIDAIAKSMSVQPKFAIPKSAIEAILSISRQQEHVFKHFRSVTEAVNFQNPAFTQFNNLQFALSGISGQLASIAASQQNWNLLQDFEEVTKQGIEFSDSLTGEFEDEQKRQFQILLALVASFIKRNKALGVNSLRVINVFLIVASLHQYYDFIQNKPEYATKQDIANLNSKQDTIISYIAAFSEQLKQVDEYRITNRKCEVRLKPNSRAMVVTTLPISFEVVVLQVHHKWILASYFDPKDNLPQTGWIKKKYLTKPEKQ